jgi:gp16 family phage-associated protein
MPTPNVHIPQKSALAAMRPPYPQTHKTANLWFKQHGLKIKAWCEHNDIPYQAAREVLCGRTKGSSGKAWIAAVALGIADPQQGMPLAEEATRADDRLPLAELVVAIEQAKPIMDELTAMGIDVLGLDSVTPKLITVRNHPDLSKFTLYRSWVLPVSNLNTRMNVAVYKDCFIRWMDQA